MTTKKECIRLIRAWCAKRGKKLVWTPAHVYPRGYVVAQLAQSCIIVARPWMDCEPQLRSMNHYHPMEWVRTFDPALKVGDWCITAYVRTEGCGESIAIPVPLDHLRAATKSRKRSER